MALRTVLTLLPDAGITNAKLAGSIGQDKLAGSIPASKMDLSTNFNFTGQLQKSGTDVDPNSNLLFATVNAATTGNIADFATGAPDPVDGVNLSANMDVLVWQQTDASENRIKNVDTVGTGADGAWTDATERDIAAEYPEGMLVYVKGGTLHGGDFFKLTDFAGTLGTSNMVFEKHEEGLTTSGEPEAIGTGDGSNLEFDLDATGTVGAAIFVDTVLQLGTTYSITLGGGTGGVDLLVFGAGNAPANGASIEGIILRRV